MLEQRRNFLDPSKAMTHPSHSSHLFQILGRPTASHVAVINQQALQELNAILDRPLAEMGLCTLLLAPRAGYGKSHLLCQVQEALRRSHEFIPLHSSDGFSFDATSTLENVLSSLTRVLPGGSGITPLDLLARKFFAVGLEPLVRSGEVPCQNRDSALLALMQRPLETFDFHHPAAVTAHWTRNHFDVLCPRLTTEISQLLQLSLRETAFWTESLFHYASAPTSEPARVAILMKSVLHAEAPHHHDRLSSLLHILSQWQRVVIVVDELEGLSANPEAALRLATFLTTLRHGAERIDVILSLNDDIWENAFLPRLSDGLLDRLTETSIRLFPLTEEQALRLLQSRYPHATIDDLTQLPIDGDFYARGLLRAAAIKPPKKVAPAAPAAPVVEAIPSATFAPTTAPTVPLLPPTAEMVPESKPTLFSAPPSAAVATFVEPAAPVSQATSAWWTVPAPQSANPFASAETDAAIVESPFEIDTKDADPLTSFPASTQPTATPAFGAPATAATSEPVSPVKNLDPVEALLQDLRQRYGNPS